MIGAVHLPVEVARRNKSYRSKLHFPHRTGRTNLKNIRKKMESDGLGTSLVDLFCYTREPAKDEDTRTLIAQLKNSLSQIPVGDQTEAFKNKVWLDNRGVDTRGRMRRVGKHIPTDQGHISKNDRMSIIQGIRAKIVQEVRAEIVQEV
ncbi:hypothetical protein ACH5RR_006353 [Cinchona calisaya]|uniref:Uncharacterized protein n=1 Tax=Cinchona calisaya TaxID=153742 RepID=A0ABD3ANR9_9GENT